MDTINYIDLRIATIFNEWARRYAEAPDQFDDILDSNGQPFEDYGQRAAAYFRKIAEEMDAAGLLPLSPPNHQ